MVNNKITYSLREKILKFLLEDKGEHTILEIAKNLKADYKNVHQAVGGLYPDLIYREKKGNLNLIEIKLAPGYELCSIEEKRTREFLVDKRMKLIKEDIETISYPFLIALIFGSFAKNTFNDKSDIDLCIISDNKDKLNEVSSKLRLLPFKIEVHEFSTKEFESMLNKKENNLAKEIVKNNVLLFGIEDYYNLISKWMKKE